MFQENTKMINNSQFGMPSDATPAMSMEFRPRGLTDVKKDVSRIKWLVAFSIFAVCVLTALNLGMVVAGIHLTRQFSLKTMPDGSVTLVKKGGHQIVHVGAAQYDNLPLNSVMNDGYFKALYTLDFTFKAPVKATTGRKLASQQDFDFSVHSKIKGWQRLQCDSCVSKSQIKFITDLGHIILKDEVVIPLLDPALFGGINMTTFVDYAVLSQGVKGKHFYDEKVALMSGGGGGFRRKLNGLFDGPSHGGWSADYTGNFGDDNDNDNDNSGTFNADGHVSWGTSGGTHTDVGGHFDFNTGTNSGNYQVGIKHEW